MKEQIEKVKEHIREHKVLYSSLATGVGFAGITFIIMRSVNSQHIRDAIGVPASRAIGVTGGSVEINNVPFSFLSKTTVLNEVSYIASNRKGSPSWVVRCKETGVIFTSQKSAAREMGLKANRLSEHLNGVREHVDGYHFERICLAA